MSDACLHRSKLLFPEGSLIRHVCWCIQGDGTQWARVNGSSTVSQLKIQLTSTVHTTCNEQGILFILSITDAVNV